jgi:hypothetical protein
MQKKIQCVVVDTPVSCVNTSYNLSSKPRLSNIRPTILTYALKSRTISCVLEQLQTKVSETPFVSIIRGDVHRQPRRTAELPELLSLVTGGV